MNKYVLITGGMGYIGSHIANKLLENGKSVIIIDVKSKKPLLNHWKNYIDDKKLISIIYDLSSLYNFDNMRDYLKSYNIIGVIHCAAFKSVPESIQKPLTYYQNNLNSTINLLELMSQLNIKTLIFSSSATVYSGNIISQDTDGVFSENDLSFPTTPYGNTKLFGEKILEDVFISDKSRKIISLRYFNPAVCYLKVKQGDTGLFTSIEKVLKGQLEYLSIFGDDYKTPDGSCIRDYIHIDDLIDAHICSLNFLISQEEGIYEAINVGTGTGFSTLEVATEFKKLNENFDYRIMPRRDGDAAISIANCDKAKSVLGWSSKRSLSDICTDIVKFSC